LDTSEDGGESGWVLVVVGDVGEGSAGLGGDDEGVGEGGEGGGELGRRKERERGELFEFFEGRRRGLFWVGEVVGRDSSVKISFSCS